MYSVVIAMVLAIAVAEIGYYEKATNSSLDDKSANAGTGNYTKYARDLDALGVTWGNKNGFAWCAMWCLWVFYKAFGIEKALAVLCSPNPTGIPVCSYGVNYFKSAGRWYTRDPQPGDIIFFTSDGGVSHQGIVEKVEGNRVTTIEGNTSDMVARRYYTIGDPYILGYGRPRWELVSDLAEPADNSTLDDSYSPIVCMMTQSTCYRQTSKMEPVGVLWHSTGANNPWIKRYVQPDDNAENRDELLRLIGTNIYRNDWNHKEVQAGLNAWIGRLDDGTVTTVQTMPLDFKPWGCGGGCNNGWIQFEICEDGLGDQSYFNAVYEEACKFTAYACKLFGIDPYGSVNGVPTILCHQDSYRYGMGSNHSDVYHWFNRYGKTMDNVRADVASLLSRQSTVKPTTNHPTIYNGAYNAAVKELQEKLSYLGYNVGEIDSDFGNMTSEALMHFQSDYGLEVDGVAGPLTWATLDKAYAEKKDLKDDNAVFPDKQAIKVGDLVSIKTGATYFSGKSVPQWVQNIRWIVSSVNGDRVVIDKSEEGKYSINSPININNLIVEPGSITQDETQEYNPSVGDIVHFNGDTHYFSSTSDKGHPCKPGKAKVSKIVDSAKAKHPYHLILILGGGSTVFGWVDSGTFEKA